MESVCSSKSGDSSINNDVRMANDANIPSESINIERTERLRDSLREVKENLLQSSNFTSNLSSDELSKLTGKNAAASSKARDKIAYTKFLPTKFTMLETDALLGILEELLPIGKEGWDDVAIVYNRQFRLKTRTMDNLRRKYNSMAICKVIIILKNVVYFTPRA
jgi:hypothetical protein